MERVAGIVLIGLSMLTTVIVLSLNKLINTVKDSAIYIRGGGTITLEDSNSIPLFGLGLIGLSLLLGIYLIIKRKKPHSK